MSGLKPSFMNRIMAVIKESYFTLADFDISFPSSGKTYLIIKFKHHKDYKLEVLERKKREEMAISSGPFSSAITPKRTEVNEYIGKYVIESPGDFKNREENEIDTFEEVLRRIPMWCDRIKEDLGVNVESDTEGEFSSIRDQLEEMFKEEIYDEKERFSKGEIDRLNIKFDALFQKFSKLQEENTITKEELTKVSQRITELKASAKVYPKGIWARLTKNKLIDIMTNFAKTEEGQSLITSGIEGLLK